MDVKMILAVLVLVLLGLYVLLTQGFMQATGKATETKRPASLVGSAARLELKNLEEELKVKFLGNDMERLRAEMEGKMLILNKKSTPVLGDEWVINVLTKEKETLEISLVNTTQYDVEFLRITCGGNAVDYQKSGSTITAENYECNSTTRIIFRTLTNGVHIVKVKFGSDEDYAFNTVSWGSQALVSTYDNNNDYYHSISCPDGNFCMLVWRHSAGDYETDGNLSYKTWNGTSWTAEGILANHTASEGPPDVYCLSSSFCYATWMNSEGYYQIMVSKWSGSSWGTPINLTANNPSTTYRYDPAIGCSDTSGCITVWSNNSGSIYENAWYSTCTDANCNSWSAPALYDSFAGVVASSIDISCTDDGTDYCVIFRVDDQASFPYEDYYKLAAHLWRAKSTISAVASNPGSSNGCYEGPSSISCINSTHCYATYKRGCSGSWQISVDRIDPSYSSTGLWYSPLNITTDGGNTAPKISCATGAPYCVNIWDRSGTDPLIYAEFNGTNWVEGGQGPVGSDAKALSCPGYCMVVWDWRVAGGYPYEMNYTKGTLSCTLPSGDWLINAACTVTGTQTVNGNIHVLGGGSLTLQAGASPGKITPTGKIYVYKGGTINIESGAGFNA